MKVALIALGLLATTGVVYRGRIPADKKTQMEEA